MADGAAERHRLPLATGVARPVLPAQLRYPRVSAWRTSAGRRRSGRGGGVEVGEQGDAAQQVGDQLQAGEAAGRTGWP